jgi:ATP-dependent Lhr-like helicase
VNLLDRNPPLLPEIFTRWFASRGWTPRAHQLELLAKAHAGRSTLLIAPTGGGKTLAGFLPSLVELSSLYLSPRAGRGRHTEGVAGEGASRFLPGGHGAAPPELQRV